MSSQYLKRAETHMRHAEFFGVDLKMIRCVLWALEVVLMNDGRAPPPNSLNLRE